MTYNFESLDTVPLHPWTTGLQLFDILIKTHRRSFFPSRSVTLKRVGSMLNLGVKGVEGEGKQEDVQAINDVEVRIKKVLGTLEQGGINKPSEGVSNLKTERLADLQASTKRNSSLLTSIVEGFGKASISVEGDKSFSCEVSNVNSQSVLLDFLMDLVYNSSWRPDTLKHVFEWPVGKRKTMKLWIVTEILYANKISVKDASKISVKGDGKVGANSNTTNIEAEDTGTSGKQGSLLVTAPKSEGGGQEQLFPFAFKALKLEYDAHGELVSKRVLFNRK